MRINNENITVSGETIAWKDVEALRFLNKKGLVLVLNNGRKVEVSQVHPSTVDEVFRVYEQYLKEHHSN